MNLINVKIITIEKLIEKKKKMYEGKTFNLKKILSEVKL